MKYYMSEAIKSLFHNAIMTLASVTTVTFCLILFGAFLLFVVNLNYLGEQVRSQCEIQVYIDIKYTTAQARAIQVLVENLENVRTVQLETKYDAFQNLKKMLGDDADALQGLEDEEFLRHSLIINLRDLAKVDETTAQLGEIAGVADIINRKDTMDKILAATDFIKMFSFYSMAIFAIIAIFIISNTIKLTVHARQREIHIMKYVGATDWFIRWPFLIEGIVVGLVGASISYALISVGYESVIFMARSFLDVFAFRGYNEVAGVMCLSLLAFGVMMGASGSIIAIRRHLKV